MDKTLDLLLDEIEELRKENKELKQEIEILVEALRDLELKLKFGVHV